MKKILILTRTTTRNFGTVLQAYALQKSVQSLGYQVFVLDDKSVRTKLAPHQSDIGSLNRKTIKEILYDYYDQIRLKKMYARENKIQKQVECFKKKYITYYSSDNLNALNEEFDVFISGSDQIWAQTAEPHLYAFFMQDFVWDSKRKISYAVSIGETEFEYEAGKKVNELINRFDFLSVREKTSYEALKPYACEKKVSIVCDPVFHIKEEHWLQVSGNRIRKQKYVFCYCLAANEWYFEKMKELTQRFSCEIIVYCNEKITFSDGTVLQVCNPKSFLNYIIYAEFVLTDSYHAMLFSLIFQKNFCVLQRFKSDGKNTQNGRIDYILSLLGINDKIIDSTVKVNTKPIAYGPIKKLLDDYRTFSINYIKNALEYEELHDGEKMDNCN